MSAGPDQQTLLAALSDEYLAEAATLPRRYGLHVTTIDPVTVEYPRLSSEWPAYVRAWPLAVCPGDWDLGGRGHPPFRERQIRELFVEGVPHRQSEHYDELVAELRTLGRTRLRRLASLEEIERYFAELAALFEGIARSGYRFFDLTHPPVDEITVRIGRGGGFQKCGPGSHRLAIARVLALPVVPVVVDLMHWQWAEACLHRHGPPLARAISSELAAIAGAAQGRGSGGQSPPGPVPERRTGSGL